MRILIVSTNDYRGGGAKVAYSLAKELRKQKHEVIMYVSKKTLKEKWIIQSKTTVIRKKVNHFLDSLPGIILSGDKHIPFGLGYFGESLKRIVQDFKPDIINIHWTGKGFVSFKEVIDLSKNNRVVWSLHDVGAVSGGGYFEHKAFNNRFLAILMKLNEKRKRSLIKDSQISFVVPSKFTKKEVENSLIAHDYKISVVYNGINLNHFKPHSKDKIRKKLRLNQRKKYLLFGAADIQNDRAKGFTHLLKALEYKKEFLEKEGIGLVSFGNTNPFNKSILRTFNLEKIFLNYISDEEKLSEIYSACDALIFSSTTENYPLTVLESICSGLPVIAFAVGGIPEIIKDGKNGFLIKPFDIKKMGESIEKILTQKHIQLKVNDVHSAQKMAKEYLKLFNKLGGI